jgi:glycosyltransferase involved in cell wall biosynthesis
MTGAPVTVGVDARAASEVAGGRGRYVRELLRALSAGAAPDGMGFRLYCREPWREAGLDERFAWVEVPARDPLWHLRAARRANAEADVFLSTNSYLTAWFTRVPTVIVVYDLVAFEAPGTAQMRAARIERATIRPALRRAAGLDCISEATRADLVARFPASATKARVIPLAADAAFATASAGDVAARYGIDRPYVLSVATLEPRKNLERLIRAWEDVDPALREAHRLVLAGGRGWEDSPIIAAARAAGATTLGHVDEADLASLYAGATAFAYPSLYEGFGLPVLEAMSAGTPVITSATSSLPEVAGDAALLVDPTDTAAIARALERVLGDSGLAAGLALRGRARARLFSWERTARETAELLLAVRSKR